MRSAPDLERILFILAVALPLFAIWAVVFPPLLDFPEHALMAQVVAHGSYDAGPDYHGSLDLHPLWAPYGMFYWLALPFVRLLSAHLAAKLWLAAAVIGTAAALRWMLAVLGRDRYAFYFAFPFLFSSVYLAGLVPYVLGFPLVIVLVTLVLKQPETTKRNFAPRLALALALVWAHPIIYAAAAPAIAGMVLVLHWRSWRQLLAAAAWAAIPAIYLAAWTPEMSAHLSVSWRFKTIHLRSFVANLGAYDLPVPGRLFLLPKIPLLLWLIFAGVNWRRFGSWSREQKALAAAVAAVVLAVIAFPELYSNQGVWPVIRFLPVAATLACGLLSASVCRPLLPRMLLLAWCLGALAGHAALAWRFDHQMDGFVTLVRRMEPRQVMTLVYEGPENMLYSHSLAYRLMSSGGLAPESFLTLATVRHFPARLLPPFPWDGVDWEVNDPLTHPVGWVFRYVLVKTSGRKTDPVPIAPYHRLVARSGGWLLYERQ